MKKSIFVFTSLVVLFFFGLKCAHNPHEEEHHEHFLEKIKNHQAPLSYELTSNEVLDTSKFIKVHAALPNVGDFLTEKRGLEITSFPCSNCHNQPLEAMLKNRDLNKKRAHWNIHIAHAGEEAMNCTTCHAKNNMDKLASLTGEFISIDESYKLCGQCHSTQYKDWQGGAHGKQLNGWKPPRVAKTCVSCHNPHQPAFESRFPARLNTQQLGE